MDNDLLLKTLDFFGAKKLGLEIELEQINRYIDVIKDHLYPKTGNDFMVVAKAITEANKNLYIEKDKINE